MARKKRRKAGFIGAAESRRLQKNYEESRRAHRATYPIRLPLIDDRCIYLCPVELRPILPEERE